VLLRAFVLLEAFALTTGVLQVSAALDPDLVRDSTITSQETAAMATGVSTPSISNKAHTPGIPGLDFSILSENTCLPKCLGGFNGRAMVKGA
jgi:hypothetical protein